MKDVLKRYRFFVILLTINLIILVIAPVLGQKSFSITWSNTLEMLSVNTANIYIIGPIGCLGERETMIKLMGEKSGFIGIALAFFLGSAAAGPLYAAFPIAGVLLKKGSKLSNVLIFIGAWSTTKIPMLLFEASAMGWKFMVVRFLIDIPGIAVIAYLTEKLLKEEDKEYIFDNAASLK